MATRRVPLFPLAGAVLFPGMTLPLHIFEPRYRAMVGHALATDRLIGMVQPRDEELPYRPPALFDVGGLGRIADVEVFDDGRYNILLSGEGLFRITGEREVTTGFRQADIMMIEDADGDALASATRAALEHEARRFAAWLDLRVDWAGVADLDDATFVNVIAQIAPFDAAAKQALLEAPDIAARAELEMQLMRFASSRRDPDDKRATFQ